jgi:large subunit ribosomal protein L21
MYAVIKAGGKQHRVKPGDVIEVELMHGAGPGDTITFSPLLVVDDDGKAHVGRELGKAVVTARLVGEDRGDKVKIFKYRPKTGYARRQGHRQMYTLLEIQGVSLGRRPARKAGPATGEAPAAGEPPEEAAPAEGSVGAEAPATGAPPAEGTPPAEPSPEGQAAGEEGEAGG